MHLLKHTELLKVEIEITFYFKCRRQNIQKGSCWLQSAGTELDESFFHNFLLLGNSVTPEVLSVHVIKQ